ncbi:MAG: hypothetical protein AB7V18_19520 [Pyrinomonadaceae bacterium]
MSQGVPIWTIVDESDEVIYCLRSAVDQRMAQEIAELMTIAATLERQSTFGPRGKLGGKARAAKLSPERRKEIAKLGAQARWKKARWPTEGGGSVSPE